MSGKAKLQLAPPFVEVERADVLAAIGGQLTFGQTREVLASVLSTVDDLLEKLELFEGCNWADLRPSSGEQWSEFEKLYRITGREGE